MKALIIEDEGLACRHLEMILKEAGNITVVAVLESIADSVEWFRNQALPEVVFMDIHLADGLSFEIFNHVQISCPIIFTTAYDEYALKAFKVNSIDYLMKPIELEDLQKALRKLRDLTKREEWQSALGSLLQTFKSTPRYKSHFLVSARGDKLIPVQTMDLAYLYIDCGIVRAVTLNNQTYIFDYHLEELVDMLDPECFFRANRQFIIARKAIRDIDLWFNNRLSLNMVVPVPEKILISKARIGEFKNWFGA